MLYRRTKGLVLGVSDFGESDKLVQFYSPDIGRATGIAKGAKRSKKRFPNKLEMFSLLQLVYGSRPQPALLFLREAELEESFLPLRQNYSRYTAAAYLCELVIRFTREHDRDPALFELLVRALAMMTRTAVPARIAVLFQLKLLGMAGYRPAISRCGTCDKSPAGEGHFLFHPSTGTILCRQCSIREEGMRAPGMELTVQTLRFLQKAQEIEVAMMDRLHLPDKVIEEALLFLHRYTRQILQQDVNSWQVLMQIIAEPGKTQGNRSQGNH